MKNIDTHLFPQKAGIFLVGGAVRDSVMDRRPVDYDLVTGGDPESTARQIALKINGRYVKIGNESELLYRIIYPAGTIDLTPLGGRTIIEDLSRRDFTINAMALDLDSGRLIDPHSGQKDVRGQTVRMISADNLKDDPLRLMRAYRLAAHFGYKIHSHTTAAIKELSGSIATVAGERISAELFKFLEASNTYTYLSQMERTGLLTSIIPELKALKGCTQNKHHFLDVFDHTLCAFKHMEKMLQGCKGNIPQHRHVRPCTCVRVAARLKLAVLLHDIGKPSTRTIDRQNQVHFYRHAAISHQKVKNIAKRLRLASRTAGYIGFVVRHHSRPMDLFNMSQKNGLSSRAATRLFMTTGKLTPDILLHAMADNLAKNREKIGAKTGTAKQVLTIQFMQNLIQRYFDVFRPAKASSPLITGHDLITEFDLSPSPVFSVLLNMVREKQLSGHINTPKEALNLIRDALLDVSDQS